jgi:hypothetical protein
VWQLKMEVVVLPVNLLTEATVVAVAVPGRGGWRWGSWTPEGQCHGHPPHSYGGSRPPDDGHETAHPTMRRRPAAVKLVEGEPPQPSTNASPLGDDYDRDRGELQRLQLRAERSPMTAAKTGGDHHPNGLKQHNDEEYLTIAERGAAASAAAAGRDNRLRQRWKKTNSPICSWRRFEVELLAGGGGGSGEGSRSAISWSEEAVEGVTVEAAPNGGLREIALAIRDGAGRFDGALGWEESRERMGDGRALTAEAEINDDAVATAVARRRWSA